MQGLYGLWGVFFHVVPLTLHIAHCTVHVAALPVQGLIDRGADISWLSQYPHEKEILFAPLTGIGVHSSRIDGNVLCIDIRLTINLTALPIERVISKLQSSHSLLIKQMTDDLQFAGAPKGALLPLDRARSEAMQREASYFNVASNYLRATKRALSAQRDAFCALAMQDAWPVAPSEAIALCMTNIASLCARTGQHAPAAALITLSLHHAPLEAWLAEAVDETIRSTTTGPVHTRSNGTGVGGDDDLHQQREVLETAALLIGRLKVTEPLPSTLAHLLSCASRKVQLAIGPLHLAISDAKRKVHHQPSAPLESVPNDEAPHGFAVGTFVLVCHNQRHTWDPARIHRILGHDSFEVKVGVRDLLRTVSISEILIPAASGIGAMLRAAAADGLTTVVGSLLEARISIFESDENANTALHLACACPGNAAVCKLLIEAGAPVWNFNRKGERPFHIAQVPPQSH